MKLQLSETVVEKNLGPNICVLLLDVLLTRPSGPPGSCVLNKPDEVEVCCLGREVRVSGGGCLLRGNRQLGLHSAYSSVALPQQGGKYQVDHTYTETNILLTSEVPTQVIQRTIITLICTRLLNRDNVAAPGRCVSCLVAPNYRFLCN